MENLLRFRLLPTGGLFPARFRIAGTDWVDYAPHHSITLLLQMQYENNNKFAAYICTK
jgi:hypothetical protein